MGQQESVPQLQTNDSHRSNSSKSKPISKIEHQGILKIRSTPFPNCVEVFKNDTLFFLQNSEVTLYQLLQTRLYTNQLFPIEDIQKLIQNVTYTLAYLNQCDEIYKDLNHRNIYYTNGQFKLLPNQLIEQTSYQKGWQKFYGEHSNQQQQSLPYLSPQLIIALRMKQRHIIDEQILSKSCVFMFGFILLETTTLMPSSQCYDPITCDIFNNIVSERLELVEQHYDECIARIIGNMIDYDFNERMDLREFAIWVNRQLVSCNQEQKSKEEDDSQQPITSMKTNKTSLTNQEIAQIQQQKFLELEKQESRKKKQVRRSNRNYSRTNMVYIYGYDEYNNDDTYFIEGGHCGSKNLVYLGNLPYCQIHYEGRKMLHQENNKQTAIKEIKTSGWFENGTNKKIFENSIKNKYQGVIKSYQEVFKENRNVGNVEQYERDKDYSYLLSEIKLKDGDNKNEDNRLSKIVNRYENKENKFCQSINEIDNPYKHSQRAQKRIKSYEIHNNSIAKYRNDLKQEENKNNGNDSSINRIKVQIEKSRQLIDEFRKCDEISL